MNEVPLYPEHFTVVVNCRRQPELLVSWVLWEHPTRQLTAEDLPVDLQGYLAYKKMHPLGPYRRPRPRVIGGS